MHVALNQTSKFTRQKDHVMTSDVLVTDIDFNNINQALVHAIENKQIHLVYQSQHCLQSKQLIGMEALCRLGSSHWKKISPDQFIPYAEQTNLIQPLERLILEQVAHDLPVLLERYPNIRLGVNLSIKHISTQNFFPFVHQWLDAIPSPCVNHLDFEITETYFQGLSDALIDGLQTLRARGIRIAMDDFGAGQSSLSRLHTLPFDVLKLDKQFAQQIEHPMVRAIIRTVATLADEFGIELIAEGVETSKQCETLEELKCNRVQGFYFSNPQPLTYWLNPPSSTK